MQSEYYNILGSNKACYESALRCMEKRERSFAVTGALSEKELFSHVMDDHPDIFYVSNRFSLRPGIMSKQVYPSYIYSAQEAKRLRDQLNEIAGSIISELINTHQSDYDKVRVFHDYLKTNLEYDSAAANDVLYKRPNTADAHTVVGALWKRKCVCEGFAKAMKFLCDKIGVECWVVNGMASGPLAQGPHSWNIVRINGYYHHVDITWDNQYSDTAEVPNYSYMNLSDEEIKKDHTWNRKHYPKCPSSPYNYFRVNNALLESRAELERLFSDSFQMEEERIMFRVVRGSILEREILGHLDECVKKASGHCKHIRVASFIYGYIPKQLTFCVTPEYKTV